MQAVAVTVHLGGEVGQLLPAFELGAIVERHDDELRRTIYSRPCRRGDDAPEQQSRCGDEFPRNQSAPRPKIPVVSLAGSRRGMDCGQQKLRRCDEESTKKGAKTRGGVSRMR